MRNENAPGHKAEGVVCMLPGCTDAYATNALRRQYLNRFGIPLRHASLLAGLCFGEGVRP